MAKTETVLFTGKTHTAPSDGTSRAIDRRLNIETSASGSGVSQEQAFANTLPHPTAEQLFAGAWSACYSGAIMLSSQELKMKLPPDLAVEVEIDLVMVTADDYHIRARFNVIVPGATQEAAEALAHRAHETCPYSKATKGNIDVEVKVTV